MCLFSYLPTFRIQDIPHKNLAWVLGFSSHGNKSASTEEQLSFVQGHTLQVTRVLLPSDPLLSIVIYVASGSIWDCHPSTAYILIPSVIVYYEKRVLLGLPGHWTLCRVVLMC